MTSANHRPTVAIESTSDELPMLADIVDTFDVVAGTPHPDELAAALTVLAAAATERSQRTECGRS